MYSIYSDGVCIYSDVALLKSAKVVNPKLTLTDNAAGSLEITLPPDNAGYSILKRLSSKLIVYRDNVEIWAGRIISEKGDFWKRRILVCEGELAYLNDSTQPPKEYKDVDIREFLESILSIHNSKVESDMQFYVGAITVSGKINDTTNYDSTLGCINDKLIKKFGGHIVIRKEEGKRYIDYLSDYMNTNTQMIRFGENLLDFVRNWDMTKIATVILPRGNRLESSPIEGLDAYLTVEKVNAGSIYVTSEEAIKQYGWIEQVVDWEDISDPNKLLESAQLYLQDVQFEEMIIEVSAVDLHYLTRDKEAIKLLDKVRCISNPHGMDRHFPVSQLTIPLDHPENATYTLGNTIRESFTSSNKNINSEIIKKIEKNTVDKESLLKKAAENATQIMDLATNGFITITKNQNGSEELYISDDANYKKATRYWRWNINGLAYYDADQEYELDENGEPQLKLAMTMDGAIVADFITVGTLNGEIIKAGSISSDAISQSFKNEVTDEINVTATTITQNFTLADAALSSEIYKKFEGYSTTTEMESSINQKVDAINLSVSQRFENYSTTTEMESAINQKANEINLSVTKQLSDYSTIDYTESAISMLSDKISLVVTETSSGLDVINSASIIAAINDDESEITLNANKINLTTYPKKSDLSLSVSNDGNNSNLSLNCGGETLDSATIRITGFVEFSDLRNSGSTTINGDNITTGTITGITMAACTFENRTRTHSIEMHTPEPYDYGTFCLMHGGTRYFSIWDREDGVIGLYSYNKAFLQVEWKNGNSPNVVKPIGDWDFSDCDIIAKFG